MPAPLENLSLRAQLRIDRLPLRLVALMVGLTLFGTSIALLVRAGLGAAPWDVLHVALAGRTGISVGVVLIVMSVLVLLLWVPLRQHPGIGTLANAVWVGIAADASLAVIPPARGHGLGVALAMMIGGVLLNALASALYIGAQLGPGPRDGLMTGLHRRTGLPVGPVRIGVEVVVLASGWALGGPLGAGTLVYALAIGPLVQVALPWTTIPLRRPSPHADGVTAGAA